MAIVSLRNAAILLAVAASTATASVLAARSRAAHACVEQADSARPGFIALERGEAPTCIRIRLR